MKRFRFPWFLFILMLFITPTLSAQPITTGSLIREMIDLQRLANFPEPAYKTVQFSSHDHKSSIPGGPGWFANSDGFGGESIPNFEQVLKEPNAEGIGEYLVCDITGPGAIVREWTAVIKGNIRMYLDGSEEPVYDGSAEDFFLRTYKPYLKNGEWDEEVFTDTFTQRCAGYYPIPFANRCRIVWIGNLKEIHFYQIQIRQYQSPANVITFTPQDLQTFKQDIEDVLRVIKEPDANWSYASKEEPALLSAVVEPGEMKEVFSQDGPKAIEQLTLQIQADKPDPALRQTILHIVFDRYPWGQAQSPVGDFFGAAPGINPYVSIPFTVKPNGEMTCRYIMPFKQSVRILLENKGKQVVAVRGSVRVMNYDWKDDSSMYFRARWRVDHDLVASNDTVQDLPFLVANGKGVYVGTAVMLLNPNEIPTSYGNWWGEGDEKIFVDDDVRPSTFGTGSEDYFNYAWSAGDIFTFPYFGQPRNDGPANRGFVTNNRWHILDNLPFQNRMSFYMELYSHETTPQVSYARLAYHYGRPGLMDDHVAITGEDVRVLSLPENWHPAARMGADNAIFFPAEKWVELKSNVEFRNDELWEGGTLMVWKPDTPGETLNIPLSLDREGETVIQLAAALTPRSGKFSVQMDGQPLDFGEGIDLYVPYRTLLRPFSSAKVAVKKGDHVLTLRFEGKAPESEGNEIGIDFIWFQ